MYEEDYSDCVKFKEQLLDVVSELIGTAKCLIPLNKEDKVTIREGIDLLENYRNGLERADTIRDMNRYFDVERFKRDGCDLTFRNFDNFSKFMASLEDDM